MTTGTPSGPGGPEETPHDGPPGWYPDPWHLVERRAWDGSSWLVDAGWYPDPDEPGKRRFWTGDSWREPGLPVDRSVIQAFASMTVVGVATVALGYVLVSRTLPGSVGASCSWDGQGATHDAWVACRRAVCDQTNAAVGTSLAVGLIPWLVLLAMAIAASWLAVRKLRGRSGRARPALYAALVPAWAAVVVMFPGLLAVGSVVGDCTT